MAVQTSYAKIIDYAPGTVFGIENGSNYKSWDDLNNLKEANKRAQCRNPDNTSTPTIAGRNGTYKRPAPIQLDGFTFDTSNMYNVEKVVVHYTSGKWINNGYYPEFAGATFTLLGANVSSQVGRPVPAVNSNNQGTEYTLTFTGVSVEQLNNLALRIAYPANSATTPGRIFLSDIYLEVHYNENTSIILNGQINKSPVLVGEESILTVTAKKGGQQAYTADIEITLPSGVEYLETVTSGATITQSSNVNHQTVLHWKPSFTALANVSSQLQVKIKASSTGTKKFNVKEVVLGSSYDFSQIVNQIKYNVTTNIMDKRLNLTEDREASFYVRVTSDTPRDVETTISIDVTGVNSIDYAELMTNQYVNILNYENKKFTIQYTQPKGKAVDFIFKRCVWRIADNYELTVKINTEANQVFSYTVNPKLFGDICFSYFALPRYYTLDMAGGISYTISTLGTLILNSNDYNIFDGGTNYRIGVYNNVTEGVFTSTGDGKGEIIDEEAFLENVQWSTNIATTNGVEQAVSFNYNSDYPVIFVYSFTYVNDPVGQVCRYNFTEPYLVESAIFNDSSQSDGYRSIVPHPAHALLGDEMWAVCTIPSERSAVPVALSDWLDGGLFDDNIAIHGLTFMFDYVVDNDCMIEVELRLDDRIGTRTLLLRKGKGTATLGNAYDLFDFKIGEFLEAKNNFEIYIREVNNFSTTVKPQINNARLTINYVQIAKCKYGFSIDGERSEWYGIYLLPDFEPHFATNNDKSEYHVEGTDETIINRLNIDPKDLKINIKVPNCTIDESIPQIDKIVDLFTNERELYSNKPIPKHIVFDIMPDRQFEFVRVKEFDDEWEGASYLATIELYIPMGTSYNINSTVTGGEGYLGSNTMVKPIVSVRCDSKGSVTVDESYLNQYMHVESTLLDVGDIVTFDSIQRKVYIGNPSNIDTVTDITSNLDFNSSWFKIKGRYSFNSSNGTILTVEYYARR